MLCNLSTRLSEQELLEIRNLEKETGKVLLSFSCHEVKPAELKEEELAKIQELEKRLGVALVALEN